MGDDVVVATFPLCASMASPATWRWKSVRGAVEGVPIVLVQDGEPVEEALRLEHRPLDEVLVAARNKGVAGLSEIRLAILEVSGKISIIKVDQGDRS